MELNIEKALEEIQTKSDWEIETQTGYTWASRACASFSLVKTSEELSDKIRWLVKALDYEHETLEHLSLNGDGGVELAKVKEIVDKYKEEALETIKL